MKKKWMASILAVLLALSILAGCGAETTSHLDVSAEPSQSTLVDIPDPEQDVEPGVTESEPEDIPQEPDGNDQKPGSAVPEPGQELEPAETVFTLSSVPAYSGTAYVAVNGNVPYFTADDLTTASFESYSSLDSLGRCGVAYACVGLDIMPTEDRGSIGQVKPTGWHTVKYDCVDGKYLYNRCHLIGYQLSAENANEKNLITGTRYMNVDGKYLYNRCHLLGYQLTGENANEENLITGTRYLNIEGMLPFENMVADYVQETDNHVLYRVTPIFEGSNLLASGVLMEGYSVEDTGGDICFCVYANNVQPGITIDYASGDSYLTAGGSTGIEESGEPAVSQPSEESTQTEDVQADYVLNTNTKKFHLPTCSSADDIKASNRQEYHGAREELIAQGYDPCKRCNP